MYWGESIRYFDFIGMCWIDVLKKIVWEEESKNLY